MAKINPSSGLNASQMPALISDGQGQGGEAMLFASLFGGAVPETQQMSGDGQQMSGEVLSIEPAIAPASETALTDGEDALAAAMLPAFAAQFGQTEGDAAEQDGQQGSGQNSEQAQARAVQAAQQPALNAKLSEQLQKQKSAEQQAKTPQMSLAEDVQELPADEQQLSQNLSSPKMEKSAHQPAQAHLMALNQNQKKQSGTAEITLHKQTYKPRLKHPASAELEAGQRGDSVAEAAADGAGFKASRKLDMQTRQQAMEPQITAKIAETAGRQLPAEQSETHLQQHQPITAASQQQGQFQQQQGQPQTSQLPQASTMSDQIADMLDMMEDNWSEMLVRRIEQAMGQDAEGIDFELNPRNLGKLRVNLNVVNDQTHVQMKTETQMAAQMIGEAEAKLAQMLEQAGLRLSQFSSQSGLTDQQSGSQSDQNSEQQQHAGGQAEQEQDNETAEAQNKASDHIVNLHA